MLICIIRGGYLVAIKRNGGIKMYKTEVSIEGMMCHNCEKHMNEAIEKKFVIENVESFHDKNLTVITSKEPIAESDLKAVVEETGYKYISSKTEEKKGFSFGKK